jgi:hypothetical protein
MAESRANEPFWGRMPKFSVYFKEILSGTLGNFEEQNNVGELSIIIINYGIIINTYYNYYHGPGLDSAPSENEFQEHSWR